MIPIKVKHNGKGFTLAELLVALIVTSIVFTAVATLAYTLGAVNDASDDTSQKQAHLRAVTLRVSELIKHCRLVCISSASGIAVWQKDDVDVGQININELVYIDAGPGRNHIRFYSANSATNPVITLSEIDSVGSSWWLGYYNSNTYAELLPVCSDVQFLTEPAAPQTRFVSVSFDLEENDITHNYQINAALRSWAGNLLGGGDIVSDDD